MGFVFIIGAIGSFTIFKVLMRNGYLSWFFTKPSTKGTKSSKEMLESDSEEDNWSESTSD